MLTTDDIESQLLLLATIRRTLAHLLQQAVAYGGLPFAPPATANGIAEARAAIARIKAVLREQAVSVDDHPDDLSPEENARVQRPVVSDERTPYLGLLTFQESNAEYFFGRDTLIADLVNKAGQAPFLAVLGPSGSGKSSVVRAGLIPALKGGALPASADWIFCPPLKPGARPMNSLAALLTSMPGSAALGSVFDLQDRLAEREDTLLIAADTLRNGATDARLVLVIDQAEELWTLAPTAEEERVEFVEQQQRPFIQQILSALRATDSPLLLLFAMRADFLHRAAEQPQLASAIGEHLVIVSPMTADELRMAIVRPAEATGTTFDPGLVDELVKQTENRPGALPLLEYTLLELWKSKRSDGVMTWDAFTKLGGVEGALAARADAVLAQRYPAVQQQDQVRKALLRLIQPDEDVVGTRRRVRLDDLASGDDTISDVQALLAPLTDARLLTSGFDTATGAETIEIAHEALIRAWPTFKLWIRAAHEDLRLQIQLEDAAHEWQHSGESPDFLWSGLRLANAQAWLERVRPILSARDQRFLASCAAAEQSAQNRELARERAFAQRLRKRAIYLAIAFVAALIIAGYAFVQRNDAQHQLEVSESRRLAGRARDQLGAVPASALLLAYEATAHNDNNQSQQILRDALVYFPLLVASDGDQTGRVTSAVFSPDGQHILIAFTDSTARLLDSIGRPLAILKGHTGLIYREVFSPDGQRILIASTNGTTQLCDVNGQPLATFSGYTSRITSAVFSPDGQRILTGSYDRTAQLWDLKGQPLATLSGHTGAVTSAVFSPDGQHILTASADGTARLWDLEGQPLATLSGHTGAVTSAMFSPDGQRILTASNDRTARLWDANGQRLNPPVTLSGHTGAVTSAMFSPDGQHILTASEDKTARLWDANGQRLNPPVTLSGHTGAVTSAVFSPDGQRILTASDDGTARLWDLTGKLLATLSGHTGPVTSAVFSPDGQRILTASDDGTARLWATGEPLTTLSGHTGAVTSAMFSPDGQRILTASNDRTARLWDANGQRPNPPVTLSGHTGPVTSAVFSPDGQRILTASDDGTARLWDLNGQPLATLSGHTGPVTSAVFSPDGQRILTASADGTARLWEVKGQPLAILTGHIGSVISAVFSPDGQRILTASADGTTRLWDLDGQSLALLSGHERAVTSAVFSPDGQRILTASDDGTARLWDTSGKQLAILREHTGPVTSAVFSPDSQRILTASADTTARLWDANGQPLAMLSGHTGPLTSAVFSADGRRIVTASDDGAARQYIVSVEDLLAVAACRVGAGLTEDNITQFHVPRPLKFDFAQRHCPPPIGR